MKKCVWLSACLSAHLLKHRLLLVCQTKPRLTDRLFKLLLKADVQKFLDMLTVTRPLRHPALLVET